MPRRQPSRSASTGSIGSANGDAGAGERGPRAGRGGRRGMGKRSSSSRPRAGVELSAQDVERVIRQSEAQLTVALEVAVTPGEADLESAVQLFLGDGARNATGEKQNAVTVSVPLLECGVRDWKHLVAFQRIIARQQRPVMHDQDQSTEKCEVEEDLLAAEARVHHDARRRDMVHLTLLFGREAENKLWKFANDLRLILQSAGITSRSLLAAMQRVAVRLTPDVESTRSGSRNKPHALDQAALHWAGKLQWRALVVSTATQNETLSIASQRMLLPLPPRSSELRYPALKQLVATWLEENRNPRLPIVVILRGIPGSGKSTLGRELRALCSDMQIDCSIFSADFFFETPRGYMFDAKGLGKAHDTCKDSFSRAILASLQRADSAATTAQIVVVDNTNTQHWEYEPYQTVAAKYGCIVRVLEMTCADAGTAFRMGQRNSHAVPPSKVVSMFLRWEHDLDAFSFDPQFDDALLTPNPVTDNSVGGKFVYVGLFLDPAIRQKLLDAVPPAHRNITADHVTVFYKPDEQFMRTVNVGSVVQLRCVEIVQDARGQAIRVELVKNSSGVEIRNKVPHITISTASGVSSSYSNELLGSASASHVPISPEFVIPATLGFAMVVQNQRVITTRSPFSSSNDQACDLSNDTATPASHHARCADKPELEEASAVTRLSVVSLDEVMLVGAASEHQASRAVRSFRIRGGRLPLGKLNHHLSAGYSSRRVLLLNSDASTAVVPTTQLLQRVNREFDASVTTTAMFDEVIRISSSDKANVLSSLLEQDSCRGLKEVVILASSSPAEVVLPTNLSSSIRVSVIGVASGSVGLTDAQQHQRESFWAIKATPRLDALGMNEEEHTRHQVLHACQALVTAADAVIGPNESTAERVDSTVLGLPSECVDIELAVGQHGPASSAGIQQLVAKLATHMTRTGVHCVQTSDPSRLYIQTCSSYHNFPLFRVRVVPRVRSDSGTAEDRGTNLRTLLNDIRAQVHESCPDRAVYGVVVALVRGILRSEALWEIDGIQAPAFVNIACEKMVCIYLQSVGCSSNAQAVQSGMIVLELLRLVKLAEEWSEEDWMENLAPVYRAFPEQNDHSSARVLMQVFKSLGRSLDGIDLETLAASADAAPGLLDVLATRLLYNPEVSVPRAKAYVEILCSSATGGASLQSLAVADTLRDLAELDSVNPTRAWFSCATSCVGNRIDMRADSLELLRRVCDAFNGMDAQGPNWPFRACKLVFRDAETDQEC